MRYQDLHRGAYGALGALMSFAAVLTACGGSTRDTNVNSAAPVASIAANATTTTGEVILAVTAYDFSYSLNRPTVPAGRVHVELINRAKDYPHEVWLYPQDQPQLAQMLALKRSGQDVDERDYLQGLAGEVEDVPAGQMVAFDANLTPGTYELGCFITSPVGGKAMLHYDMGMHTLLTVQ